MRAPGVATVLCLALLSTTAPAGGSPTEPWDDVTGPQLSVVAPEKSVTRSKSRTFTFTAEDPSAPVVVECSADSAPLQECVSPVVLSGLAEGMHQMTIRARDAFGNATEWAGSWRVDTTVPSVGMVQPSAVFTRSAAITARWLAADSGGGVAGTDVRWRRAKLGGTWSPWTVPSPWRGVVGSSITALDIADGFTYCFAARSHDLAGNTSVWSSARCSSVPLDDRALVGSGRWFQGRGGDHYATTYRKSTQAGATLTAPKATVRRMAVVATRCDGCGAVEVLLDGTTLRKISLQASKTRHSALIPVANLAAARTGNVTLRVTTRGKPVIVDGLALAPYRRAAPSGLGPHPVVVRLDKRLGPRFTDWGFDLKRKCLPTSSADCISKAAQVASDPEYARRVFESGDIDVVRIAFRADDKGVTPEGHFKPDYYADTVAALAVIRSIRPDITVLASRDTITDCGHPVAKALCLDFAPSLKVGRTDDGALIPSKLGRLAAEYLEWMGDQGVEVDILSLENEPHNNEGELTPRRFRTAVEALDRHYDAPLPQLAANCSKAPDEEWLEVADQIGLTERLSHGTHHAHPKRRLEMLSRLQTFPAFARSKGLVPWNTELHWYDRALPYENAVRSLQLVFDHFDAGHTGLTWWTYRPRSAGSAKGQLQSALVDSTHNARPAVTQDWDGPSPVLGMVTSRAFRRGDDLFVWIANDTDQRLVDRRIAVAGPEVHPVVPRYVRWKAVDSGLVETSGHGHFVEGVAAVNLPPRSITLVKLVDTL